MSPTSCASASAAIFGHYIDDFIAPVPIAGRSCGNPAEQEAASSSQGTGTGCQAATTPLGPGCWADRENLLHLSDDSSLIGQLAWQPHRSEVGEHDREHLWIGGSRIVEKSVTTKEIELVVDVGPLEQQLVDDFNPAPRVLLIGDSVVYGNHFLDQADTISARLTTLLRADAVLANCQPLVMAMAASSWGGSLCW